MIALAIRAAIALVVCSIFGILALIIALGGTGLLGWAMFMALAETMDPPVAAVLTALAAFAVALVFALFALVALRLGTRPRPVTAAAALGPAAPVTGAYPGGYAGGVAPAAGAAPALDLATASQLGSFVGSQVSMLFRSRPIVAGAAALAAGLAVGLLPGLRRTLLGLWR